MEQLHEVLVMILLEIIGVIIGVILIFGVHYLLSPSHAGNHKNNILVLGRGPIDIINDNLGAAEKNYFSINFTEENKNFC